MIKSISKPTRIVLILHLCTIFSIALWYFSTPFMQDLYLLRKRMMQTEFIMGKQDGVLSRHSTKTQKKQLAKNALYFKELSQEKQMAISNVLESMHQKTKTSFQDKTHQVLTKTLSDSPFFLSWLILSVIISVFFLKQKDGARPLLFLMPLLALFYSADLVINSPHQSISKELALIPSEDYLVTNYLNENLTGGISKQKQHLEKAWNNYIIKEWAPDKTPDEEKQIKGTYLFQLAKFNAFLKEKDHLKNLYNPLLLILLVFWNLFVAVFCFFSTDKKLDFSPLKNID